MGCCGATQDVKKPRQQLGLVRTGSFNQIREKYIIHPKFLGTGTYGKVFLGTNSANKDFKVAIKTLSKRKLTEAAVLEIKDEIKILQALDHPNIIRYFETFENEKFLYLVMEYCEGGELFDKLTQTDDPFTEQEAAKIMQKLFHAISHCHSIGITHRDLKPENIMFKRKNQKGDTEVKIIDFGLSKQNKSAKMKMKTTCGTPYYVAPEVLDGSGYGSECDIWSLGVIMYILLSGYLPFHGNNLNEIYDKILETEPSFERKCWDNISDAAIELIKQCLSRKAKNRITAAKALESPWFDEVMEKETNPLSDEVFQALKNYEAHSMLKKEAMNVLIKMLKDEEIENLREEFRKIDKDYTGTISAKELEEAIRATGKDITADEIKSIIEKVDYLENGKINYSEFLAATVSAKTVFTDEMLWALFKHFDTDNSGYISAENIKESFEKSGKVVSQEEINVILQEHDIEKNGKITFEEFKAMLIPIL